MAKNDIEDFEHQLDMEFEEKVEGQALLVFKKVGMELLSRIVLKTPVDTGRARGNWVVSIGERDYVERDVTDKQGGNTIMAEGGKVTALTDLRTIWVQNNLAYIGSLEDGHSKQAPAGMVAVSIAEVESMFRRVP